MVEGNPDHVLKIRLNSDDVGLILTGLPRPDTTQTVYEKSTKNTILNTFQTVDSVPASTTRFITAIIFNNWHGATNEMNVTGYGDTLFHMAPANSSIAYVFPSPIDFAAASTVTIRSVTSLNANFMLVGWEE